MKTKDRVLRSLPLEMGARRLGSDFEKCKGKGIDRVAVYLPGYQPGGKAVIQKRRVLLEQQGDHSSCSRAPQEIVSYFEGLLDDLGYPVGEWHVVADSARLPPMSSAKKSGGKSPVINAIQITNWGIVCKVCVPDVDKTWRVYLRRADCPVNLEMLFWEIREHFYGSQLDCAMNTFPYTVAFMRGVGITRKTIEDVAVSLCRNVRGGCISQETMYRLIGEWLGVSSMEVALGVCTWLINEGMATYALGNSIRLDRSFLAELGQISAPPAQERAPLKEGFKQRDKGPVREKKREYRAACLSVEEWKNRESELNQVQFQLVALEKRRLELMEFFETNSAEEVLMKKKLAKEAWDTALAGM